MLETSKERIKLMKAGYTQKEIEEMYLAEHNFTISLHPFLFEIVELDLTNEAPLSRAGGVSHVSGDGGCIDHSLSQSQQNCMA